MATWVARQQVTSAEAAQGWSNAIDSDPLSKQMVVRADDETEARVVAAKAWGIPSADVTVERVQF